MLKIRENIKINPIAPTFYTIIMLYLILAFFDSTNSLTMLGFFILLSIFSSTLSEIIYNSLPLIINFSDRFINILQSFVIGMFAAVSIYYAIEKLCIVKGVIINLLILTLIVIGCSYIVLGLINTGFPKLFRQSNILAGFISILLSVITTIVPALGYLFLIIILCTVMVLSKALGEFF